MQEEKPVILVVDDEPKIGTIISDILRFKGYMVQVVSSGQAALQYLENNQADLVMLDLMMPGLSGMQVLEKVMRLHPEMPVIIISAFGTIKAAVEAIKKGAYDFIEKPLDADRILIMVKNALEKRALTLQTKNLQKDLAKRYEMIGKSPAIKKVFSQIEKIAPTNSKVLISGESGTGKELVAQAIHNLSTRVGKPLIKINCAAIPENLIESELFGYEKGAFTGAATTKKGRIELAHKGTLFLDEIGDIPLHLQAKLLRVIENMELERLGSLKTFKIDFRLITATNKNLQKEIRRGNFREDLYYRLKNTHIHIPPLRERKDDIPLLTNFFVENYCFENNLPLKAISDALIQQIHSHTWPGNIRELRHFIENAIVQSAGSEIIDLENSVDEVFIPEKKPAILTNLKQAKTEFEKNHIKNILKKTNWNVSETARILGIERTHLHKKIKVLEIIKDG